MVYSVSAIEEKEITIKPENVIEEILQNVWVILNTLEYDCPLIRGLGLNASFVDKPIEAAQALCVADIYDKIELYEPRAEVLEVTFKDNHHTGKVYAIVEVEIHANSREEYSE